MRCAVINNITQSVENIIIADPILDTVTSDFTLIGLEEDSPVSIGWLWDGSAFTNPNPESQ